MSLRLLLAGFEDPEVSGRATACILSFARKAAARGEPVQGIDLQVLTLPWSHKRAAEPVTQALRGARPDYFLLLGTDPTSTEYKLQVFAANYADDARPDMDGVRLKDTILDPDGPVAYRNRLPLDGVWDKFLVERVPVRMSHKAGFSVFNHVYYDVMRTVQVDGIPTRCGALETPPMIGEEKPYEGVEDGPPAEGRREDQLVEEFEMILAVLQQLSGAVEDADEPEASGTKGTKAV